MSPRAGSRPEPDVEREVGELDALTRRLRWECPWDREQDERSIVPHTVEEAYELADAVAAGDDAKLRDELGDVLFQVHFLSLLMEERGAGDLAAVAEVPANLPSLLLARKLQRRAASAGFEAPAGQPPGDAVREELAEVEAAGDRAERFLEIGDLLFSVVSLARRLRVDPELALRAAGGRFRERVEAAGGLAHGDGREWAALSPDDRLEYWERARPDR